MRKIKNNVFLLLALLPLATYLFVVFRSGTAPDVLVTLENAFGSFGAFFEPIITPLFTEFVEITDSAGVALLSWCIGYYIALLFAYLVFSLFTFLITMFMDKVDHIRGGR